MNFLFLYFLLFFCSSPNYGQNHFQSKWDNYCKFLTDGTGKSLGIKLKISYPCQWVPANGERPHIVKKFSFNQNGTAVVASLAINNLPKLLSKPEVDGFLSPRGLKELSEELGTHISGRMVKIDGLDCGEIIFKSKRELPVGTIYMYTIQYHIIYDDKTINLSYAVGSGSESKAFQIFNDFKTQFRVLAGKMVVLSRWE